MQFEIGKFCKLAQNSNNEEDKALFFENNTPAQISQKIGTF